jgi:muramoyltetrapeptide carboxypeptidase
VGGKADLADGHGHGEVKFPDEIMEACFGDLTSGQGEGAGWRQNRDADPAVGAARHVRNATLWGGNLSVLTSLLGTPYFPEVKGGVLFLEDVAEHPYRIERMLTQLLHAGVLARQKAIVLGQFTEYSLVPHDRGYRLSTVVNWLRQQIRVPVVTNLPYGHVATKVLLPVGASVELMLDGRDALLFWGAAA